MVTSTKKENLQESFDESLIDTDLINLTGDITEISIDSFIKDGTLKDIPIVGAILGLARFGANVQDKLFLKKIVAFLMGLKSISVKDRKKMINKIDESKKYRIKVGEKLLYIIDNCNDYENAESVACIFRLFLESKINYDEFIRCSNVIEKITNYDFKWFLENGEDGMSIEDVPSSLIGAGLIGLQYERGEVSVSENTNSPLGFFPGPKYKAIIEGSGVDGYITEIGKLILDIFKKDNL